MFHHMITLSSTAAVVKAAVSPRIRNFSSTVAAAAAASPRIRNFSSTVAAAAAASPISAVLYPKINNKVVAVKTALSPRIRNFSSSTVAAAAASPISAVLYPKINNKVVAVKAAVSPRIRSFSSTEAAAAAAGPPPPSPSPPLDDEDENEISLRPFQLTDMDDIMAWGTDEELSRYCVKQIFRRPKENYFGWELIKRNRILLQGERYRFHGWDLEIYRSKEDALEDIKNNIIPHPWFRAICLKKNNNNRPIGKIFIHPCCPNNPYMAELGYVVASEHWGKGIATTAVKMTLATVFKEWPHLTRLQALVHVGNLGGQRVLEKAGFRKECVFPYHGFDRERRNIDLVCFSFMRSSLDV